MTKINVEKLREDIGYPSNRVNHAKIKHKVRNIKGRWQVFLYLPKNMSKTANRQVYLASYDTEAQADNAGQTAISKIKKFPDRYFVREK